MVKLKHQFLQKASAISVSTSLAFIALGTGTLVSCGNGSNEADYEEVEVLTKGVKTYIQETEAGNFKISKEEQTEAAKTEAIVSYLNGNTENISSSEAQILIDNEVKSNPDSLGKIANLPNTLLYSGMGYFLANLPGSKLGQYRADSHQSASNETDSLKNTHHRHGGGMGFFPLFWLSRAAFSSGIRTQETMASSRIRTTRPISGRSGFFRSSGRGGFMG